MQKFLPTTPYGWWLLIGCALSAQVIGQSLIAYAFAHLPATFGAVGLYVQVLAAAVYAWLLLGERLTPLQLLGAVVVLLAIAFARSAGRPAAASADGRLRAARVDPVERAAPERVAVTREEEAVVTEAPCPDLGRMARAPLDRRVPVGREQRLDRPRRRDRIVAEAPGEQRACALRRSGCRQARGSSDGPNGVGCRHHARHWRNTAGGSDSPRHTAPLRHVAHA